jgi:hypothetical protein
LSGGNCRWSDNWCLAGVADNNYRSWRRRCNDDGTLCGGSRNRLNSDGAGGGELALRLRCCAEIDEWFELGVDVGLKRDLGAIAIGDHTLVTCREIRLEGRVARTQSGRFTELLGLDVTVIAIGVAHWGDDSVISLEHRWRPFR